MHVLHERCCGLDMHKKTISACVLVTRPDGAIQRRLRTFGAMTANLLVLSVNGAKTASCAGNRAMPPRGHTRG